MRERWLGSIAAGQMVMNAKNTISEFKRLLGRKFDEPDAQLELKRLPVKSKRLEDGSIGLEVMYRGESSTFTPDQITAMFLGKLKQDIEQEIQGKFHDVVLSCPGWFNDAQRHALINSAAIAGLNVVRLMHETTATALQYGIFKHDLPESNPLHVMFIDFGHSQLSVSIVAFTKKEMKIIASAYDPQLGGRNFDDALVSHFAAEFKQKFNVDVYTNPRALLRVRVACEKLKRVLSANPEAPISIESLMNDVDVKGFMKRDQFEALVKPLLDRTAVPVRQALEEAKLAAHQLSAVEIVGGATRIPSVQKLLAETLGREPGKTQNASECVIKGCVLAAAMNSVGARVKEYKIKDDFLYPINLLYAPVSVTTIPPANSMEMVKRHEFPVQFNTTFHEKEPFQLVAEYADLSLLPQGTAKTIGKWIVEVPASENKQEIKVKLNLSASGTVNVESAQLVETIEVVEPSPTTAPATPSVSNPVSPPASGTTETKEADKMETETTTGAEKKAEVASPTAAPELKKRKTTKYTTLKVRVVYSNGLSSQQLKLAQEEEGKMGADDKLFIETAERRNALEAYILSFKSKLNEEFKNYTTEQTRTEFSAKLNDTENWLNDAPEETTKSAFVEKLSVLQKIGDSIDQRYKDFVQNIPDALRELQSAVEQVTAQIATKDAKFEHITAKEREKVSAEAQAATAWIAQQSDLLAKANKTVASPVTPVEVSKKRDALQKLANEVMNKPKPAPPKEEKKPEEPKKEPKTEEKKPESKEETKETKENNQVPNEKASSEAKSHMDKMEIDA